mmetsp:Transcript_28352/g.60050  ORF Transcript_28352/g.60050 Transcript_28352/m.60050 type:complete len:296 (-) Transcript_28352:377-1264(-)
MIFKILTASLELLPGLLLGVGGLRVVLLVHGVPLLQLELLLLLLPLHVLELLHLLLLLITIPRRLLLLPQPLLLLLLLLHPLKLHLFLREALLLLLHLSIISRPLVHRQLPHRIPPSLFRRRRGRLLPALKVSPSLVAVPLTPVQAGALSPAARAARRQDRVGILPLPRLGSVFGEARRGSVGGGVVSGTTPSPGGGGGVLPGRLSAVLLSRGGRHPEALADGRGRDATSGILRRPGPVVASRAFSAGAVVAASVVGGVEVMLLLHGSPLLVGWRRVRMVIMHCRRAVFRCHRCC